MIHLITIRHIAYNQPMQHLFCFVQMQSDKHIVAIVALSQSYSLLCPGACPA